MLVKQRIKYIQSLGQKKFRQQEGLFIAEGDKIVRELLASNASAIQEIFAIPEWIEDNKNLLNVPVTQVTEIELERISQLATFNQVLALVRQYDDTRPNEVKDRITLVLDDIRDPGNMGTLIRIADWFGIPQIVCSQESADLYNPKVVQATMGSIARVKVHYTDLPEWLSSQDGVRIYAAALEGQDIGSMKKIKEGIIVIGNESHGISAAVSSLANVKITIPRKGNAESLNAAVASGIILSHLC